MYTVVRKYDLIPGTKEKLKQRVQECLIPILRHVPGLTSCSLLEAGDNEAYLICTFYTIDDAKASVRLMRDWMAEQFEFLRGFSTLAEGQVRVQYQGLACLSPNCNEELLRGTF